MFGQISSIINSTSSASAFASASSSAIMQRAFLQDFITSFEGDHALSNDSFEETDSGYCSLDELELEFDNRDDQDDDIEILLDPSQLNIEEQLVYEMLHISII
ncbi:hypothetical protein J3Q64DRAFT_1839743 [Phycomyces blakesleeanus]|uniref:Uncharacterized protein n=2 Tax=Phycomyces blakesleeanus TaxID=4837 RepID=A0A167LVE6_PHYB8|nr:hypothetical protein PHYBLDRAFT_66507 [Phycomyces blakesleeanus NRRL 1555(-)]OAD71169.1 hypothetical protein PHYBLDRAFT_66507 [Phycomyces blakesleeanus NRRL 1555(-)]|eukprot:XP_018289209.1 hypothetical protein PHYBLDRAFT_66507 [Phycomyces blakesleeanus NRRL 1555(-)]